MNELDFMGSPKPCFIWPEYEARWTKASAGNTYVEHSPRAGGKYVIPEGARYTREFQRLDDSERARLTTWLVNQRTLGVTALEITVEIIKQAKRAEPLAAYERADRLLRHIASQMTTIGEPMRINTGDFNTLIYAEAFDWADVQYFVNYLVEQNWITSYSDSTGQYQLSPTVPGHSRIAELLTNVDSSQVFVAMWLDDSMNSVFDKGIEPAIRDAGYKAMLISKKEHINKIDDEIVAEIRRSGFIVADFSQGDDGARGGVYFEAGFAHGLDLNVIYTCRKEDMEKLHFDTRQYSHIVWETPAELRASLKTKILAVLGEGPKFVRQ